MGDFNRFLKRVCKQTAVYWERTGSNGYQDTYADPVEIDCRWSERTEVITDYQGREVISNAQVLVLEDLVDFSMLKLCTLNDLDSSEGDDPKAAGARKILRRHKIPTIDGQDYKRMVFL